VHRHTHSLPTRRSSDLPKVQFTADPRCIASILRTLRAGGAVCLYPAGQTSMTGRPGEVGPAIARLVRKCGVSVAFLQLHGGFFRSEEHTSELQSRFDLV